MSGRFYNESVKLTDKHSISIPVIVGGVAAAIYFFGFGIFSGFTTTLFLQIVIFAIVASTAWSISTQGIIRTIMNFLAFGIALYLLIQMAEAAPKWLRSIDVSGYENIIAELDSNYAGHVELGGENGFTFNAEGNTPNFYAPPAQEIPTSDSQAGGGVPIIATPVSVPVALPDGTVVYTAATPVPQPTVDILALRQNETYGFIERDMIDRAFDNATETYAEFNDEYSFNIIADIQHARDIKANRQNNLPVANSGSASFMAGGEEARTESLLAGNNWLIVMKGESFGWLSCTKNLIIEQQDGLLKGSQFTIKECTISGLSEKGKIGTTFSGGV